MLSTAYGWTPKQIGKLTFPQLQEYLKPFYSSSEEKTDEQIESEARGLAMALKQMPGMNIQVPPNIK